MFAEWWMRNKNYRNILSARGKVIWEMRCSIHEIPPYVNILILDCAILQKQITSCLLLSLVMK